MGCGLFPSPAGYVVVEETGDHSQQPTHPQGSPIPRKKFRKIAWNTLE